MQLYLPVAHVCKCSFTQLRSWFFMEKLCFSVSALRSSGPEAVLVHPLATARVFSAPALGQIFTLCWLRGSSGLCLVPGFAGLSQLTPGRFCCRHSSGTQGTELVSSQLRCPGAAPSSRGCWALGAAEEPSRI